MAHIMSFILTLPYILPILFSPRWIILSALITQIIRFLSLGSRHPKCLSVRPSVVSNRGSSGRTQVRWHLGPCENIAFVHTLCARIVEVEDQFISTTVEGSKMQSKDGHLTAATKKQDMEWKEDCDVKIG